MKRWKVMCLILTLMLNMVAVTSHAGDYVDKLYLKYDGNIYKYNGRLVTVVINGTMVETGDMPGVIIDSRTLVPVREVFESDAFGATVSWNGELRQVTILDDDKKIVMTLDDKIAYVNGVAVELDVPPMLIQDVSKEYPKTMIPLRFVSEALSFDVAWDNDTYTAALSNVVEEVDVPEESAEDTQDETEAEKDTQGTSSGDEEDSTDQDKQEGSTEIASGEKLDSLTDEGAKRTLPTALKEAPVTWVATSEALEALESTEVETTITEESHEETTITNVAYEDEGIYKQFVIKASSAMSAVDYFVWDSKFIIDIENAVNDLNAETTFDNNPILTGVRASQFSVEPNAARIVMDLIDAGNRFNLSFNEERTELYVRVTDNSIHTIELGQNDDGDYIEVIGVAAPDVKMFRLSAPDRIVIDFPNTQTLLGYNESDAEGQYVQKIRTAQFDETTTRIVVETDGQADYQITKADDGQTIIQFTEPGYKNIGYENVDNPTISLEQDEEDIDFEGIAYENDYMNRRFTITLSENYGTLFGDGSLKVNDGIIDTVDVSVTDDGYTQIAIQSTSVYEYRIEEDEDRIYIRAYKPKEIYDQIVVVDAGHGGKDPGALANGLYEKEVNLDITMYLMSLLEADDDIKVYYTRTTDVYPTLQERCDLANEVEADMFLSIHNNAFNPAEEGTETLYFPSSEEGKLTSPKLAGIFQDYLVDTLGTNDRGIKQRENLFVLKHTAMPAIITEIGFLTNTEDAAKLTEESYKELVAEALYDATLAVFETYPTQR